MKQTLNTYLFLLLLTALLFPVYFTGPGRWIVPGLELCGIIYFLFTQRTHAWSLIAGTLMYLRFVFGAKFFLYPVCLLFFIVLLLYRKREHYFPWFRKGVITGKLSLFMLLVISTSSIALFFWLKYSDLSIDDLIAVVPDLNPVVLLILVPVFAFSNALLEEFVYRGFYWESLQTARLPVSAVLLVQAVHFGLLHFQGFPRGTSGVALAAFYGLALGLVRRWSRGIAWPVITHFFADVVIALLVMWSGGVF